MLFFTLQIVKANKPKDDGIIFPERMEGKPEMFNETSRNSYRWDEISSSGNYGRSTDNVWTVYVTNKNANIYSSASGTSTLSYTELNFMEDFYVADLVENRVLLYYSEKKITDLDYSYGEEKRKIIKGVIEKEYSVRKIGKRTDGCIGWVNVKDLLLWEICPRTEEGIFKKIAVVKNTENATAGTFKDTRTELFADPECRTHFSPSRYVNPLDFCYAFKRSASGENVLVYNGYQFNGGIKMENQQIGWIKQSEFIDWNTRICWEPAFKGELNNYAYSFNSEENAENEDMHHILSKVKLMQGQRKNAQTFPRFPVTDFDRSIAELSVLGMGKSDIDYEKIQGEYQKLEKSLSRINIVFVMDATNSMKPCFDAVKRAVDDISTYKYRNDNVYFGVVVYRNYKDAASGGLDQCLPLTNDCDRVSDFLSKVSCYSASADPQEAMFHGLNYAADKMDWQGSISNFVVLITDVSTKNPDEKGLSANSIINKYASKQINLVSYQVRSQKDAAYRNFSSQMVDITEGLLTKLGYPITSGYNERTKGFMYYQTAAQKKFPLRPMAVRYKNADDNSINSTELTDFTINIIKEFIDETDRARLGLKNHEAGGETEFDKSICEVLIRKGVIRKCEDLQGFTFKVSAYSFMNYHPYDDMKKMYTPCVFMSDKEYDDLVNELEKVIRGTSQNRREILRNAAIKLILSYSGQKNMFDISSSDIIKHINEIERECGYTFYRDVKDLIRKPETMSDNQINAIINRLRNEITRLENLRNKSENYKYQDGHRYFYILLEDMPMVIKQEED